MYVPYVTYNLLFRPTNAQYNNSNVYFVQYSDIKFLICPNYLLIYLLIYLLTCLFTYLLACLLAYLLIFLLSYVLTYLHLITYLLHGAESFLRS